jgi:sugar phosphate isomerase/epimerase
MSDLSPLMRQLACSPCCLPKWTFEDLLPVYGQLGFSKMEAFTEWAQARLDWREDPMIARGKAHAAGLVTTSFHLPLIHGDDVETGLANALAAARYAEALGAKAMLLKASSREVFRQIGIRFLNALEQENIQVTPVVQNHRGSAISTLEDYQEVFDSFDNDPRLKAVLEVGHFHRVGVDWQTGWEFLADRIALIHINDIRDGMSAHYGTGEVDFAGLMRRIKSSGYDGEIVVELELENRDVEPQETLDGLKNAVALLTRLYERA